MKESVLKTDRNIIFKETFGSEDLVRANGGTPVGVTFANGVGTSTTGSKIIYPKINLGITGWSFECKFKWNTDDGDYQMLFGNTGAANNCEYIGISPADKIVVSDYTNFQVKSSTASVTTGVWYHLVVVFNGTNILMYINGVLDSSQAWTIGHKFELLNIFYWNGNAYSLMGDMEYVNLYKGTLTANEVKNLYENRQNREINTAQTLQLGTELIVNANDRNFESGTTGNWTGSYKSTSFAASTEQKHSGTYSAKYVSDGTGTGEIRLSNSANTLVAANTEGGYITAWVYSSHAGVTMSGRGLGNVQYASSASTTINGWQELTVFVPDGVYATTSYTVWFTTPNGATVYIDDISWKKTLNNTTKEILRVDARNGVIANKYSGSTYDELVTDPSIETATWTGYNAPATSARSSEQAHSGTYSWKVITNDVNQGASNNNPSTVVFTSGKVYRISAWVYPTSTMNVVISARNGGSTIGSSTFTSLTANTWNNLSFTYTSTTTTATGNLAIYSTLASQTFYIDDISVKEVIPTVTPTAVSVVRSGNVYAMDFNGSTSKIDCGSYDTMVGNKTLVSWLRPRTSGENDYGGILDKDSFSCNLASTGAVRFTRNAYSTLAEADNGGIKFGTWNLLVITSTSTGITNFFINGVLSGTANQSGGTPVGNANQITVGNRSNSDRTFNGELSNTRLVDGILSTQEIAQIYQSEKTNYGL